MQLDTIGNTGPFTLQVSAFVWKTRGYESSWIYLYLVHFADCLKSVSCWYRPV